MLKKISAILMCILFILVIGACGSNNSSDSLVIEEDHDEISNNIITDFEIQTLEDFIQRLSESTSIELKNVNNEVVGTISNRSDITQFIDRISEYEIKDDYIEENSQDVIGPLNVYFGDGTAIYGLMKEEYIYIDGYYFLLNRSEKNYIVNHFSRKTREIS